MTWLRRSVERQWYTRPDWLWCLLPLTWLFRLLSARRRKNQSRSPYLSSIPIVVVGNISVGGTGKTPVIIALAKHLQTCGRRPVIISRGYGAVDQAARQLPIEASASEYGDEPVLIARATACPVVVGADRVAVVQYVERNKLGDFILSDDGLQHYRLGRRWEIAVVDGQRAGEGFDGAVHGRHDGKPAHGPARRDAGEQRDGTTFPKVRQRRLNRMKRPPELDVDDLARLVRVGFDERRRRDFRCGDDEVVEGADLAEAVVHGAPVAHVEDARRERAAAVPVGQLGTGFFELVLQVAGDDDVCAGPEGGRSRGLADPGAPPDDEHAFFF